MSIHLVNILEEIFAPIRKSWFVVINEWEKMTLRDKEWMLNKNIDFNKIEKNIIKYCKENKLNFNQNELSLFFKNIKTQIVHWTTFFLNEKHTPAWINTWWKRVAWYTSIYIDKIEPKEEFINYFKLCITF